MIVEAMEPERLLSMAMAIFVSFLFLVFLMVLHAIVISVPSLTVFSVVQQLSIEFSTVISV
jgi:low affinity Fe/Cu permease